MEMTQSLPNSTDILAGELLDKQIQLRNLEIELERRSELFKKQVELRNQLNQQIDEIKTRLKETAPTGKVVKKVGDNEISVNIWTTLKVSEGNLADMPSEYITEDEIYNVVERDGHYYQKHGNTTLVKNHIESGMDCPSGFIAKRGRAISIKFNGKPL